MPRSSTSYSSRTCASCRHRKIRCDRARPRCGQCLRLDGQHSDCDYSDLTQTLETDIARVQQRIAALTETNQYSGEIVLSNPYLQTARSPSSGLSRSPSERCSISPHGVAPPMSLIRDSLDVFLAHGVELGFFLHAHRFRQTVLDSDGLLTRPSPDLLNAIVLWASHISPGGSQFDTATLLSQALAAASISPSISQAYSTIYHVQAKVLLANFFFTNGRLVEGRNQAGSALAVAIGSGLHRLDATDPRNADPIAHGERINGFWSVLALNNCWSGSAWVGSLFDGPGNKIRTPWPFDVGNYEIPSMVTAMVAAHSNGRLGTVDAFLQGQTSHGPTDSVLSSHVKATVLLERAGYIASQLSPRVGSGASPPIQAEIVAHDRLLTTSLDSLPALSQVHLSTARSLLLIRVTLHAASIELHSTSNSIEARRACLDSARRVWDLIFLVAGDQRLMRLLALPNNPALKLFLGKAFRVLCSEVEYLKSSLIVQSLQWQARAGLQQRLEGLEKLVHQASSLQLL